MTDTRFSIMFEMGLMALIAVIAGVMAGLSIKNKDASGAAAWSALLMAIVNMVKEGRQSRTIDRMGSALSVSTPKADGPQEVVVTNTDQNAVPVEESKA